jgi:hypothetical protein
MHGDLPPYILYFHGVIFKHRDQKPLNGQKLTYRWGITKKKRRYSILGYTELQNVFSINKSHCPTYLQLLFLNAILR